MITEAELQRIEELSNTRVEELELMTQDSMYIAELERRLQEINTIIWREQHQLVSLV